VNKIKYIYCNTKITKKIKKTLFCLNDLGFIQCFDAVGKVTGSISSVSVSLPAQVETEIQLVNGITKLIWQMAINIATMVVVFITLQCFFSVEHWNYFYYSFLFEGHCKEVPISISTSVCYSLHGVTSAARWPHIRQWTQNGSSQGLRLLTFRIQSFMA